MWFTMKTLHPRADIFTLAHARATTFASTQSSVSTYPIPFPVHFFSHAKVFGCIKLHASSACVLMGLDSMLQLAKQGAAPC